MRAFALALAFVCLGGMPAGAATAAAAAPTAVWQRGEAAYDVKGNVSDEQARKEVQLRARSNAIELLMGRVVADKFVNMTMKRDQKKSSFILRELSASVHGLVVDVGEERWSFKPIMDRQTGAFLYTQYLYSANFKVAPPPPPDLTFGVELKLSTTNIYAGDALRFEVDVTKAAHLMVFNLAADDRVNIIYPNRFTGAILATPGHTLKLPAADHKFEITPYTLEGHAMDAESLRVIATRNPVKPPPSKDGSLSIIEFMRWLYALPPSEWSEAEQSYTIVARKP